MKLIEKSLLCSFLLILVFSCTVFSAQCSDIEDSILRMHVIANSNEEKDQKIKLEVRDAVIEKGASLLENVESKDEAMNVLFDNLQVLEEIANCELLKNGFNEKAEVSIEKTFFPTKQYEKITLPAGQYDSLLIKIGEAKGENFWCIMFPSMCLPTAQKEELLNDVLSESEYEITVSPKNYKIQWKTAEIFEKLKNFIKKFKE